jgi:hypothetical protein
MPRAGLGWPGRRNFDLNSATVMRDLYRLVTMVLADRELSTLAETEHEALARLRMQFIEDELVHLLIGSAVTNRLREEHMRALREDPAEGFQPLVHDCGLLKLDVTVDCEIALTFREACNKIIHAEEITTETEQGEAYAFPVMPRHIVLRGHRGQEAWEAHLDLVEYVRASVRNFGDLG